MENPAFQPEVILRSQNGEKRRKLNRSFTDDFKQKVVVEWWSAAKNGLKKSDICKKYNLSSFQIKGWVKKLKVEKPARDVVADSVVKSLQIAVEHLNEQLKLQESVIAKMAIKLFQ